MHREVVKFCPEPDSPLRRRIAARAAGPPSRQPLRLSLRPIEDLGRRGRQQRSSRVKDRSVNIDPSVMKTASLELPRPLEKYGYGLEVEVLLR